MGVTSLEGLRAFVKDVGADVVRGREVLVTGGAGFIGSWLSESLVALGAKVTALDNLSTGSLENVEHLLGLPNFKFVEGDVSRLEIGERYDFIVHAASVPAPED
jgi:nucleoside-diphosphate-sugar epimerase